MMTIEFVALSSALASVVIAKVALLLMDARPARLAKRGRARPGRWRGMPGGKAAGCG